MNCRKLAMGIVVAALGATLFIGCAKPPTEQVDALTAQFTLLQEKGGQVFAQTEYDAVSAQVAVLQTLMDEKKYRDAAAQCDSVSAGLQLLSAAIDTNGEQIARQEVSAATEGFVAFKTLVEANRKLLSAGDLQAYAEQNAMIDAQIGGLQAELDARNFFGAYSAAKSVTDQLTAATEEVAVSVGDAKAAKGGVK